MAKLIIAAGPQGWHCIASYKVPGRDSERHLLCAGEDPDTAQWMVTDDSGGTEPEGDELAMHKALALDQLIREADWRTSPDRPDDISN